MTAIAVGIVLGLAAGAEPMGSGFEGELGRSINGLCHGIKPERNLFLVRTIN
jgi:hypothetical protein